MMDNAVNKNPQTGALKSTPAHNGVDFAVRQRHNLPTIGILNPDGN
jgi:valyl-tRNA synthetase